MDQSFEYIKKVWPTSIAGAMVLATLSILPNAKSFPDVISIFKLFLGLPMGILFMCFITIPSAIILYFSVQFLLKLGVNSHLSKLILSLLGILLVCAQVAVMGELRFTVNYELFLLPYWIAIVFSVWIYKLRPL